MINGGIILESLRENARIGDMGLVVRDLYRFRPDVTAPGHPAVWSVIEFEGPESCADQLAEMLASAFNDQHGWYVESRSPTDTFIVSAASTFAIRAETRKVEPRPSSTAGQSAFPSLSSTGQLS